MSIRQHIIDMAKRQVGVRHDEVIGVSRVSFNGVVQKLIAAGLIHKAKVSYAHVRYFFHVADRDAFLEQVKLDAFQKKHERPPARQGNAPWAANTPAIVPPHVKVQVCPAYTPRFQERVLPFVHGVLGRG